MTSSKGLFRLAQSAVGRTKLAQPKVFVQPAIAARLFHTSPWSLEEKKPASPSKDEDPVSFRLSMYQSTFDRIQREKADSDRFAKLRRTQDRSWIGTTVSLILRMCSTFISRRLVLTNYNSRWSNCRVSLLPRSPNSQRTPSRINYSSCQRPTAPARHSKIDPTSCLG